MAAADYTDGFIAMKQYTYVRGKLQFIVPLYEMETGNLLALIEADYMGRLRTGAASGVATKYMAARDAKSAAIIGTGGQAKTQLEAIAAVKQLEIVHAYGRDPKRREAFCEEMSKRIGVPVHAASSVSEAVQGGAHRVHRDDGDESGRERRRSRNRRAHQRDRRESRAQARTR